MVWSSVHHAAGDRRLALAGHRIGDGVGFRCTSDQKAIHVAKDQLKAHLLAVRLFQDQISVVMKAYWRIILGTGRYIRLAFMPLLFVIIPITLLIVEVDRYLGWTPMETAQSFLVKVKTSNADALNDVALNLPPELAMSAPPVHVPAENEVVWRVTAEKDGTYDVNVAAAGQTFTKRVVVASGCFAVVAGAAARATLGAIFQFRRSAVAGRADRLRLR